MVDNGEITQAHEKRLGFKKWWTTEKSQKHTKSGSTQRNGGQRRNHESTRKAAQPKEMVDNGEITQAHENRLSPKKWWKMERSRKHLKSGSSQRNGEQRRNYASTRKALDPNDCCIPKVTGYRKVHKKDMSLRGVAPLISSLCENTAKVLVPIVRSLQSRTRHYIKNNQQLKELLKEWSIQRDKIFVATMSENSICRTEYLLKYKRNVKE